MSRLHTPDYLAPETSQNPWLWAQIATAFLFGALVALLITTPRRVPISTGKFLSRKPPVTAVGSTEPRNVSQSTLRQVKPVELHRPVMQSASVSQPKAVEVTEAAPPAPVEAAQAGPQLALANTPPAVRVALDPDSRPHASDLVVDGGIDLRQPETTSPATKSATTEETTAGEEFTPGETGAATDEGPALDTPVNEASDGREAKPGDEIHKAPANHVDPSEADMSEVNQREAAQQEPVPVKQLRELTAEQIALRGKLKACIDYYYREPVSVSDYGPWGIMHALIAYGVDTNVYADGKQVNAIGWICYNGRCRGQRLFELTPKGEINPLIGVGVQGHPGQYLSMLAQSKVRTDYPLRIDGHDFTVADLIAREQETCRVKTELTFKLIALTHYLDTDTKWKSDIGEDWDIPKLIREELAAPIIGAACGGTHRMTGFSYAVNKRMKEGKSMDGQWERARKYLEDFKAYTFRLQNSDGSFSSNWFAGRGDWGGPVRKLETTGHITEWLISACSDEELADPRVIHAVNLLTNTLIEGRGTKWEIGPRGHGLHALVMYDERVYGAKPGERRAYLPKTAAVPAPTKTPPEVVRPGQKSKQELEQEMSTPRWFRR